MNAAAISLHASKKQVVHRTSDTEGDLHAFAMLFKESSIQLEHHFSEKQPDGSGRHNEKVEHVLNQVVDGEKIKEDLLSYAPLIPVEDQTLLVEETDWIREVAHMSDALQQAEAPVGKHEIEATIEKLGAELIPTFHDIPLNNQEAVHVQTYAIEMPFTQPIQQASRNEQMEILKSSLGMIDEQALALISGKVNGSNDRQILGQLTRLLEEFHSIKQELSSLTGSSLNGTSEEQPLTSSTHDEESNESIWNMLKSLYEKRSLLTTGSAYGEQAKVRSTDVGSWLDQMMTNTTVMHMQPHIPLQQYMSPVEQHVLHTNVHNGAVQQSEQMIDQLKQIMMQSGFGSKSMFQQLSISIQPEQLGEMTIRLIQIEGQMIAKITVHSQAAKQALESQMHQLKHMFAPHQVVIEKQEGVEQTQIEQDHQREDIDDMREEQHEESNDQEEHQETSFQEQFEHILNESTGE